MLKKQTLIGLLVIIIVIGSISFGAVMYSENRTYKNYLKAQYQMSVYNLLENVKGMQVSLSKATVAEDSGQRAMLFEEISRKAEGAKSDLHNLPINHESISQTSKFLAQVGDYTYTLVKNEDKGEEKNKRTQKTIEELKNYSSYLTLQLQALENEMMNEGFDWDEIRKTGVEYENTKVKDDFNIKFKNISKEMQSYPTLIYDGPFSDNALNVKPRILKEKVVSKENALKNVKKYIDNSKVSDIKYTEKVEGTMPAYSFKANLKNQKNSYIDINISENGGKLIYMLNNRDVSKQKISMDTAIEKGKEYIKENGYTNMIPLYSLKYDNVAIINYVYVKDNIIIYPDQIKVKVALDNGEIIGIDGRTYLKDHNDSRKIDTPKIDYKKYKTELSKRMKVENIRLALIPVDSTKEVLCYEYVTEKDGEKYIVYINAITGKEENILKVLETSNGELTM